MDKFLSFFGGVIGGYALTKASFAGTFLASLDPVLNTVGVISITVFSVALIYKGINTLIGK